MPGADRGVTPLELLVDLVYVFAVGEWSMTAWGVNLLAPDTVPERLLLAGLAFASLLMSVSISGAFDDGAWLFVTGYLALQIGRAVFLAVALRGGPLGAHFVNDLVWEVATGALWIAGAFAGGDARLVLWALAVAGAVAGVGTLHWLPGRGRAVDRDGTGVSPAHLIERFRLFFIIALGETVLIAGAAFVSGPVEAATLAALAVAFTGTIALWGVLLPARRGPRRGGGRGRPRRRPGRPARHLDAHPHPARPHRGLGRRRDGDRPSRRRGHARVHAAGVRRPGALTCSPRCSSSATPCGTSPAHGSSRSRRSWHSGSPRRRCPCSLRPRLQPPSWSRSRSPTRARGVRFPPCRRGPFGRRELAWATFPPGRARSSP